jgi:hypothetical protein
MPPRSAVELRVIPFTGSGDPRNGQETQIYLAQNRNWLVVVVLAVRGSNPSAPRMMAQVDGWSLVVGSVLGVESHRYVV